MCHPPRVFRVGLSGSGTWLSFTRVFGDISLCPRTASVLVLEFKKKTSEKKDNRIKGVYVATAYAISTFRSFSAVEYLGIIGYSIASENYRVYSGIKSRPRAYLYHYNNWLFQTR